MDSEQCFLIPFYEYMKTIIGVTALQLKNGNCNGKQFEFQGNFTTEFNLNFDNNLLLTESRKHKSNKFDIRLIMRFCKMEENTLLKKQNSMVDCFPQNLKLLINGQPIQLSYLPYDRSRPPGRMNPRLLNITNLILDSNNCTHTCNIQWVQDDIEERFNFALFLVRRRSFEELSSVLMKHRMFSVQSTLNLLMERIIIHPVNNKSNIEYMFQDRKVSNTSLICPVSLSRIKIPVRGGNCTHLKCFDLMSFLIINFIKPTWACPICDKKAFFCLLKIDGLIYSIINDKRSNLMDEIKFNENGQWKSYDEVTNENLEADNFYDIPEMYYSLKINNEQLNDGSKIQRRPETVLRTELNKDIKNILPISDWMSLKNEFISSNVTNMIALHENNTTSSANSKCLPLQTLVSKKSAISISSQTNVPINSKTRVFQENRHQTNLMSNPNNNTSSSNSKRTHENSISESVNEKELPVKKPTLDSSCVPKLNVSKTTDERVRNDESHNKDSGMSENPFVNYLSNQPKKPNPFAHVVQKEKHVYQQIEVNFFSEVKYYNNYVVYQNTEIPNKFKFGKAPKRTMMITTIGFRERANIIDIFPDLNKEQKLSNLWIHSINRPFTIFLSGTTSPIYLEKHHTLEIINSDGREGKISFRCIKDTAIIAVEVLNIEKPVVRFAHNEPTWTYNVNDNDIETGKSFVRMSMSPNKEDRITSFVSFRYAALRDNLASTIVAATVLNYDGELILNSIITPREPVKHYHTHAHGLQEPQIRGNWDGEEFKIKIRKILDSRILVGMHIHDFLRAAEFPVARVMGIRDLSNALCFDEKLVKNHGNYSLKYLEKQISPRNISNPSDLVTESDARSVREIYLKIRQQWIDHIEPGNRNSSPLSTVKPTFDNFTIQRTVTEKDNELGPSQTIVLQDEDEVELLNDTNLVLSDAEIPAEEVAVAYQQDDLAAVIQQEDIMDKIYPDLNALNSDRTEPIFNHPPKEGTSAAKMIEPVPGVPDTEETDKKKKVSNSKNLEVIKTIVFNEKSLTLDEHKQMEQTIHFAEDQFQDFGITDPNILQRSDAKFNLPIQYYSGRRVEEFAIVDSSIDYNRIEISGQHYILSSLAYVDELTGAPLIITKRFNKRKARLVKELVNEKEPEKKIQLVKSINTLLNEVDSSQRDNQEQEQPNKKKIFFSTVKRTKTKGQQSSNPGPSM